MKNYTLTELVAFMNGSDRQTYVKLMRYFSSGGKHLLPEELKFFWDSLTENEKSYYRTV